MAQHEHNKAHDHPLVGFGFLALVGALLFFAAKAGLEASHHAKMIHDLEAATLIGDQGHLERSETMVAEIVREYPDRSEAYYVHGIVLFRLGKLDEADKAFMRALELDPKDWESVAERATIKKIRGDVDGAVSMLESIPGGEGHVFERMRDEVWLDVRGDERMVKVYNRHRVSMETGIKQSY
jgi:tetratricopeptide (TPR) repeat protein